MKIHTIQPAVGAVTSTKRLGRGIGSGLGKTSGKGHKGQWARSGGGVRPGFEGGQTPIARRLPKRGFNNKNFSIDYDVVNVEKLNVFEDGAVVTTEALLEKRIIRKTLDGVKVLGNGELTAKLEVSANAFSKSAIAKIEAAGGTATTI